jgi:hypothetical protein
MKGTQVYKSHIFYHRMEYISSWKKGTRHMFQYSICAKTILVDQKDMRWL